MKDDKLSVQSMDFAVSIIELVKDLKEKRESIISNQIGRSGTSIGANISEAEMGQTKADFYAKMYIALKEANETYYWLRLLHETEYLTDKEFESIANDATELISILVSICKTKKQK